MARSFLRFVRACCCCPLGLSLTLPLSVGPVTIDGYVFSLYWMLLGMTISVAGLQSFYLGCLSQLFHDYTGRAHSRWLRLFSYNRSVAGSVVLILAGIEVPASDRGPILPDPASPCRAGQAVPNTWPSWACCS